MVVIGQIWLYSGKLFYLVKSGYNRANVIVLGQKWLYWGKSGCIGAKVVVFRNVVVFRQKLLYSGKLLHSGKVVAYRERSL